MEKQLNRTGKYYAVLVAALVVLLVAALAMLITWLLDFVFGVKVFNLTTLLGIEIPTIFGTFFAFFKKVREAVAKRLVAHPVATLKVCVASIAFFLPILLLSSGIYVVHHIANTQNAMPASTFSRGEHEGILPIENAARFYAASETVKFKIATNSAFFLLDRTLTEDDILTRGMKADIKIERIINTYNFMPWKDRDGNGLSDGSGGVVHVITLSNIVADDGEYRIEMKPGAFKDISGLESFGLISQSFVIFHHAADVETDPPEISMEGSYSADEHTLQGRLIARDANFRGVYDSNFHGNWIRDNLVPIGFSGEIEVDDWPDRNEEETELSFQFVIRNIEFTGTDKRYIVFPRGLSSDTWGNETEAVIIHLSALDF